MRASVRRLALPNMPPASEAFKVRIPPPGIVRTARAAAPELWCYHLSVTYVTVLLACQRMAQALTLPCLLQVLEHSAAWADSSTGKALLRRNSDFSGLSEPAQQLFQTLESGQAFYLPKRARGVTGLTCEALQQEGSQIRQGGAVPVCGSRHHARNEPHCCSADSPLDPCLTCMFMLFGTSVGA